MKTVDSLVTMNVCSAVLAWSSPVAEFGCPITSLLVLDQGEIIVFVNIIS